MTDQRFKNVLFKLGDLVRKKGDKGQWHGRVVGFYSTECTPIGYAVESQLEKNSVQIYPESALEAWYPSNDIQLSLNYLEHAIELFGGYTGDDRDMINGYGLLENARASLQRVGK